MTGEFTILPTETSEFVGIIVCNNCYYPTEYIDDLNSELAKLKLKGRFLIDLLLVNGVGHNRFAECFFSGERLDTNSIKTVINVPKEIRLKIGEYFFQNHSLVDNSILTRAVKFKMKRKLAA